MRDAARATSPSGAPPRTFDDSRVPSGLDLGDRERRSDRLHQSDDGQRGVWESRREHELVQGDAVVARSDDGAVKEVVPTGVASGKDDHVRVQSRAVREDCFVLGQPVDVALDLDGSDHDAVRQLVVDGRMGF